MGKVAFSLIVPVVESTWLSTTSSRPRSSTAAREYLAEHKYTCVTWNCVPRDWVDQEGWVPTALAMCAREPEALVVIHDYVAGSMKHLDRFCGELLEAGHTIRQAFPESCLPMRAGIAQPGLDALTTF